LLTRAAVLEAKRCDGCVRGVWENVMQCYPELALWRSLREHIHHRVWNEQDSAGSNSTGSRDRSRSRERSGTSVGAHYPRLRVQGLNGAPRLRSWDLGAGTDGPSRWARKWRAALRAILPSGEDGAVPATDSEVRKLAFVMWKDIVKIVEEAEGDVKRGLQLFRADSAPSVGPPSRGLMDGTLPAEWAFIPMSDLLLVIGDSVIGITNEGVFADNRSGYKRLSLADCYKKKGDSSTDGPAQAKISASPTPAVAAPPTVSKPAAPTLQELLSGKK